MKPIYMLVILLMGGLLIGANLENTKTISAPSVSRHISPPAHTYLMTGVVINEFMASNDSTVADTAGEYDDWIELYNNSDQGIDLSGYYLSDKADNLLKWRLDTTITLAPDAYLIIWADENGSQGPFHANFKLSALGEVIYLSDSSGMLLDSVIFGPQITDQSMARHPNGTGSFSIGNPTFNANNDPTSRQAQIDPQDFRIFPNPANHLLYIEIDATELRGELSITNSLGQLIYKQSVLTPKQQLPIASWPEGLYFLSYKGLTRRILVSR